MNLDIREIKDRKLFNTIADKYYIKDIYPVSSNARNFQLFSLFQLLFKEYKIKKLGLIVEIGCGGGASSEYLKGHYDKYIGIDYSEELIHIAQRRYSNKNIKFICSNIKKINLPIDKIDFIFGVGVLHHVSDMEKVLNSLQMLGNNNTIYGFIEPQSSNPFIQGLRKLRMRVDKSYSTDQVYFKKKDIRRIFEKNGFDIIQIKYQGYFTPPFAQIIMKPAFIFSPISSFLIIIDRLLQDYCNNKLAWNLIWIAKKRII